MGVVVRDEAFGDRRPSGSDRKARLDDAALERNWRVARRAATASAGLAAALAAALHSFVGVSAEPLVLGAAAAALVIGLRLPAAAPRRLRQHAPV